MKTQTAAQPERRAAASDSDAQMGAQPPESPQRFPLYHVRPAEREFLRGLRAGLHGRGEDWLADKNVKLALISASSAAPACRPARRASMFRRWCRTHMYAANYTNFDQARRTLEEIPETAGLKNCAACSDCSATLFQNTVIIQAEKQNGNYKHIIISQQNFYEQRGFKSGWCSRIKLWESFNNNKRGDLFELQRI